MSLHKRRLQHQKSKRRVLFDGQGASKRKYDHRHDTPRHKGVIERERGKGR